MPEFWNKPALTEPTFAPGSQPGETVLTHCVYGWGYRIHCCNPDCRRRVNCSADDLLDRFARAMGATLGDVAARMKCQACGSRRLYLSIYQSAPVDSGHRSNESRQERELAIMARAFEIAGKVPVIGTVDEGSGDVTMMDRQKR